MKSISYSAVRADLAKKMNQVCEDHEPIIITRANSKPVVMLSLEDYQAMEETAYLLQNPANTQRLAESIDEVEKLISKKK